MNAAVGAKISETAETLSPGFFDPVNDTSLEVTIPSKKDVDDVAPNAFVRFVSTLFVSATEECACGTRPAPARIQKIYSY